MCLIVGLLVGCWCLYSGSAQYHFLMVVVRIIVHVLVEVYTFYGHEGVSGVEECCLWVEVGCHNSFSYFRGGGLFVMESLLQIIGRGEQFWCLY